MPLDRLVDLAGLEELKPAASALKFSASHIVGVGLSGRPPETLAKKCWMYFPENDCPFYRVTVFSNYSPNNVPEPSSQWSLMAETAESSFKPVDASRIVAETIEGMRATRSSMNPIKCSRPGIIERLTAIPPPRSAAMPR